MPLYNVTRNKSYWDDPDGLYQSKFPEDPNPPELPVTPPGAEWVDKGWKDDGTGFHGAYPNWEEFRYEDRDPRPAVPYFDRQQKRYFGEPVHVEDDMLNVWMPDDGSADPELTLGRMLTDFGVAFGCIGALIAIDVFFVDGSERCPVVPKQYPFNELWVERGGDPNVIPTAEDIAKLPPIGEPMHCFE